jgi:hypothetical protein
MNDICVYSIWTHGKQISHDNYCQTMTHEIWDIMFRLAHNPMDYKASTWFHIKKDIILFFLKASCKIN